MSNMQRSAAGAAEPQTIGDWLQIEADGTIIVFTGKVEVGQNIRTSLAQAVADELRVPVDAVHLVMGDTARTPFDFGTVGSRTTPHMASRLRQAAASTRELLLDLAAERWRVDRDELHASDGRILHRPSGRSVGYGELTQGQRLTQEFDEHAPITPPHEWTRAGITVPRVNGPALVTGAHQYTSDLAQPGMLVGAVLRPPTIGARLKTADLHAAQALPGVTVVREGDFIGVAAPDRQTAQRALALIQAEWFQGEQIASHQLFEYLRTHPAPPDDQRYLSAPDEEHGSVAQGKAAADHTIAQTYTHAYIAHAPLEPRAAVAEWQGDRLTVWTGTQRPFGVRSELAQAFGIPEEQVRVIVPDTGSGYGGKHTGDAAIEAARIARAARQPVKLVWRRDEEFIWAYVRPAGVIDAIGAVRANGRLTAWEFHNYNSGAAAIQTPYDVPNRRIVFHPTQSPLRQGSYRALAATANHFARETLMDELAVAIGMDPLAFRLKNLSDQRLRDVLEAAAERFGWGAGQPAPGHGYGIAGGTEKGSYVATCAEVAIDSDTRAVRVVRVVQAFECGAIVNPGNLHSQVEGAIVQGLGGALFEQVTFEKGTIHTDGFSSYRVPRFSDMPTIDVVLLDRKDLPSVGGSETPIVGIAPAIGNAIYAASGIRLRGLPLVPEGRV